MYHSVGFTYIQQLPKKLKGRKRQARQKVGGRKKKKSCVTLFLSVCPRLEHRPCSQNTREDESNKKTQNTHQNPIIVCARQEQPTMVKKQKTAPETMTPRAARDTKCTLWNEAKLHTYVLCSMHARTQRTWYKNKSYDTMRCLRDGNSKNVFVREQHVSIATGRKDPPGQASRISGKPLICTRQVH